MEKTDASMDKRTETLCRTCAKTCARRYALNSKICNFSTTIKGMIVLLVPQMETVLCDNDVICNFCRKTLIHCVRFIDKCLRIEADRKENDLSKKKSLDNAPITNLKDSAIKIEVENFIDVDQKDTNSCSLNRDFAKDEVTHQVNHVETDQVNHEETDQVNHEETDQVNHEETDQVNHEETDQENHEETDQVNHEETDQVNHEETNQRMDIRTENNYGINDNILQNDLVNELPRSIFDHDRLISAQMCNDKLNEFFRILSSNDVRTIQYSPDSGSTTENKRVILVGSTFKCSKCYAYFDSRGKYTRHLKIHDRFEKRQEERDRLRKLRIQRLQEKEARKLGTQMNGPNRKQRRKKVLECKNCSEKFTSKEEFELHLKKHPPIVCEKCGKAFTKRTQMYAHKAVHNEKNSYVCEVCGMAFKTKGQLRQHALKHQNIEHSCKKCPKVFATVYLLRNHMKNFHGEGRSGIWPCKECGKIFKRACLYQIHYRQIHIRNGPRKCDICGQGFFRNDYLTRHKRRHMIFGETKNCFNPDILREIDGRIGRIRTTKLPPGPYTCQICMKVIKSIDYLKRHILSHGKCIFRCKSCSRTFNDKYQLAKHERYHEKSDLFRCGNCWKLLETKEDLELHYITHDNLKYKCELCEESFSQKHLLNDHIANVHTVNDPTEEEIRSLMMTGLGTTLYNLLNNI